MYKTITHDVQIIATPTFSPDRSEPEANRFFWTYTIEIENLGAIRVQLLERVWRITDGNGRLETVRGPGVVGETPDSGARRQLSIYFGLRPDDAFRPDVGRLSHDRRRWAEL